MSRAHRIVLFLFAALLVVAPFFAFPGSAREREKTDGVPPIAKLQHGMTPEQVRRLLGAPKRVARQILYRRYREQWIYDAPISIRLTFECRRGRKPQLLSPP